MIDELTEELSDKQHKALAAYLNTATVRDACRAVSISEGTWYRWMREPAFAEARRRLLSDALGNAAGRLQVEAEESVKVLAQLRDDPKVRPTTRMAAAGKILGYAFRAERISEIEALVDELLQDDDDDG